MTSNEYAKLRDEAATCLRAADRADAVLERELARLREEFGAASLDAAVDQLRDVELELAEAEREHAPALEAFRQKWGGKL